MHLESLFQLCVKVLVEQRGRRCAQRSCEPDTCCHLFGGTAFYMQQIGCDTLICEYKVSYAS